MKKILIIDDEKDFVLLLKKNLEVVGDFEVQTCHDGQSGVEKAKSFLPDVILCDIMMPGISGKEVVDILRKDKATAAIPVAFLTALVSSEETLANRNYIGGEFFISKPIRLKELLGIIEELTKKQSSK